MTPEQLIEMSMDYFKGSILANSHKAHRDRTEEKLNSYLERVTRGNTQQRRRYCSR
jgi:hypothetical protein